MAKAQKQEYVPQTQNDFIKLIETVGSRHRPHEVFKDFCEFAAISISNSVDLMQRDAREQRYMELVKRYTREEMQKFPQMLACVVNALERGFQDFLGAVYMQMEMGKHFAGQYFSPWPIALMMARISAPDRATFEASGEEIITFMEPAAGAGVMIIASAEALKDNGINYQQHMHATTVDIDLMLVHMAYIQFTLFHIPAIVIHGNSLSNETWSHWVTPAHVLGFWDHKLRRHRATQAKAAPTHEAESLPATPVMPVAPAPEEFVAAKREQVIAQRGVQLGLF